MSERKLVFLIGSVQLLLTLDFTLVLPLGPDFAKALGIPISKLGLVGASYNVAEAVVGIAGVFFLDRFDRRRALVVALTGLVIGTAASGFATGLVTLVATRALAGAFGGVAETLVYTIVTDAVVPERRGRAIGAIASMPAVASVLGVPAGLELARLGGWRVPFFTLAALGTVFVAATSLLPPQRAHLFVPLTPFRDLLRRSVVWLGLTSTAIGFMAHYALIPNLSAYFQFNRGYPRDRLGLLYMIGGLVMFANTRLAGWLSDRHGTAPVVLFGAGLYAAVLIFGFIYPVDWIPVLVVFIGLTIAAGFRFVPMRALLSRILAPQERARFLSIQSAVFSVGSGIGAALGAQILGERPDRSLTGIDDLAWLAIALTLTYAALGYAIERRVRARISASARSTSAA